MNGGRPTTISISFRDLAGEELTQSTGGRPRWCALAHLTGIRPTWTGVGPGELLPQLARGFAACFRPSGEALMRVEH